MNPAACPAATAQTAQTAQKSRSTKPRLAPAAEAAGAPGTITPDPGYRLVIDTAEAAYHRLVARPSRPNGNLLVLVRDQPNADGAVELLLARYAQAIDDRVVPRSIGPSFVAGFIIALQRRRLGDFAFDTLVELEHRRAEALRRQWLRPRGKRSMRTPRPARHAQGARPRTTASSTQPNEGTAPS